MRRSCMHNPNAQPTPLEDLQPDAKAPAEKLPPKLVDFAERYDDPAQARELERQQDA